MGSRVDLGSDISEGTPAKRRKVDYSSGTKRVTYDSDDNSADDLFDGYDHATVATQPLNSYKRPVGQRPAPFQSQSQTQRTQPTQPARGGGIFAQTLAGLQSSNVGTQPTQPLHGPSRSSPDIEVLSSSPHKPAPPRRAPLSSMMAPPGTAFRRPMGMPQSQPPRQSSPASQDLDHLFNDPPVSRTLSDDEDDELQVNIKPTTFVRGTEKPSFRHFAYNANDDSASAYGGRAKRPISRQAAPSRAMPVQVEMSLEDITDTQERIKVQRMQNVATQTPVSVLWGALRQKRGNYDDAINFVLEEVDGNNETIDLTSDPPEPTTTGPIAKTKQDVRASQTIRDKYRQQHKSPIKKPEPVVITSSPVEPTPAKPRKRLKQGRRERTPETEEDVDEGINIDAMSEEESEVEEAVPVRSESENALLQFINSCALPELIDLANSNAESCQLIISKRPFNSLDQARAVDIETTTTTKKRANRKTLGERIIDVCEDMWEGYEAVDKLVGQCNKVASPLIEAMKKWGVDASSITTKGELELVKLEDPHDSGIGTPSSTLSDDDAITGPKRRRSYLQQPAIMSTDLIMKDYQVFGLNWLSLLWSKRTSCILADDMGLGKTCQVIAFLAHLKETEVDGTHLVIVPGSTLENWIREFTRFCPDLTVEAYYGGQKERETIRYEIEERLHETDVVLTTYDIAVSPIDNKFLRRAVRPKSIILDEGHYLRNSTSQRYDKLMRIPAEFRLLLTGTPLQNNLQELASLLGFIMPQLFDESRDALSRIFSHKATTTDNASHAALLSNQRVDRARSIMAPFILRRKKAQVLSALPAKHRRVEYCSMVPEQQRMWNKLITKAQADRAAAAQATAASRRKAPADKGVHMSSLRFCALHPLLLRNWYTDDKLRELQKILIKDARSEFRGNREDLVWKYLTEDLKGGDYGLHSFCRERADYIPSRFQLEERQWMELSGKIPVLKSLLKTWIASGSRALIFSQFTTMLNILESVFSTLDISFVRLDGSTPMADRQVLIDTFTNDDSVKVFMLSTKAGGAGINLAAADKVVIMEGGFNPQDEIQAENRAHRVGQTRDVEVVRLVTKGTVEELILALAESKLALDEKVGGGSGATEGKNQEESGAKEVQEMLFSKLDSGEMKAEPVEEKPDVTVKEKSEGAEESKAEAMDTQTETSPGSGSADAMDVDDEEEVKPRSRRRAAPPKMKDVSDEEVEDVKPRGRRAAAAKGKGKPPKVQKQGSDIGEMFKKGLRKRGLDVD